MHCDNTVLHYYIAIYKHIHGDLLTRICYVQAYSIHNNKSTHISLIRVYFHTQDNNTIHIFCLYVGIFIYAMIIQFYSTISSFINIYMAITEWIIAKYINTYSDISIFFISFRMYHHIFLHIFYTTIVKIIF